MNIKLSVSAVKMNIKYPLAYTNSQRKFFNLSIIPENGGFSVLYGEKMKRY